MPADAGSADPLHNLTRELLLDGAQLRRRENVPVRGDGAFPVGGHRHRRVDIQRRYADRAWNRRRLRSDRRREDVGQVGGGVGAEDEDSTSLVGKGEGRSGGHRRFSPRRPCR